MSNRKLKVYPKPGSYLYNRYDVPEMRFGGVWMLKAGFSIGDHIDLIVEENQIVIRHATGDEIPNMVEEAPGTVIPD